MLKKAIWIFLAIIILLGLGAGFWFWQNFKKADNLPPISVEYFYLDKIKLIQPIKAKEQALPETLIIKPGKYTYQSYSFDLAKEGLYSFKYDNQVFNRIVYERDRLAFVSSLAWLDKPSAESKSFKYDDIVKQSLGGHINLSCGNLTNFANTFAYNNGITARVILGLNPDQTSAVNTDSGHNMLEVMVGGRWIVFDLTNNAAFDFTGKNGLTFWQFYQKVINNEPFDMTYIAGDENARNEEQIRQYYKDIFKVPLISDGTAYRFPSDDQALTDKVIAYSKKYQVITRADWLKRFYYGYGYK